MAIGANTPRGKVIGVAALVLIAAAGVVITKSILRSPTTEASTRGYYTIDDGATLFSDSLDLLPPFDHNGQQAVRARVFSCDGNKTHFIGYLEKYDPEAFKQRNAALARGEPPIGYNAGPFVKKPGAQYTRWVSANDGSEYTAVISVTSPTGSTTNLEQVFP